MGGRGSGTGRSSGGAGGTGGVTFTNPFPGYYTYRDNSGNTVVISPSGNGYQVIGGKNADGPEFVSSVSKARNIAKRRLS